MENTTTTTMGAEATAAQLREASEHFAKFFGMPTRKTRRFLVAIMPDGKEHRITRQRGGYYNGPQSGQGCSPLSYAKEVWRAEGARIVSRSVPV
jgi:hypothetical protein